MEYHAKWDGCSSRARRNYDSRLCGDLAPVVATKHLVDAETFAIEIMRAIKPWLERAALTLADKKTGSTLIVHAKRPTVFAESLPNAGRPKICRKLLLGIAMRSILFDASPV